MIEDGGCGWNEWWFWCRVGTKVVCVVYVLIWCFLFFCFFVLFPSFGGCFVVS